MRTAPLAALVALATLPSLAAADDRATREEARRAFAAGQAADRRQAWQEAIEHYLRANELVPHPFAIYNIAVNYERLGKLREAATWFERYLAQTTDAADRERVRRQLLELEQRPAPLAVSAAAGARVFVDGVPVGTAPYSGTVRGGFHRVVAVELDGRRANRDVQVAYGEAVQVELALAPAEAASPAGAAGPAGAGPGTTASRGGLGAPPVAARQLAYFVGASGGADTRGSGAVMGFEAGLRAASFDAGIRIGRALDTLAYDAFMRWSFWPRRITPVVGGSYSYMNGQGSYGGTVGLRFDAVRTARFDVSLLAEACVRIYTVERMAADATTTETGVMVPVTATLLISYK